jgi:hypothetical protein
MPKYSVDSVRQPMTATGIVDAIPEWEETPEGRRRPSDRQARNEDTGMPLWGVEVLYIQTAFGRRSKPAPLTAIGFENLGVEVRTNKVGGLVEIWSADGVIEPPKSQRQSADKAA